MSASLLTVRCPHCAAAMQVAPASPEISVRCPTCGQAAQFRVTQPAEAAASLPIPPHLAKPQQATDSPATASVELKKDVDSEEDTGDDEADDEAASSSWLWNVTVIVVVAMFLVSVALVGMLGWQGRLNFLLPRSSAPPEVAEDDAPAEPVADEIHWSNAEESILTLYKISVRVLGATYGPVRGRDANGTFADSEEKDLLAIELRINNRSFSPQNYESWHAPVGETAGDKLGAVLYDSHGTKLTPYDVPLAEVLGRTPSAKIRAEGSTTDVLIFRLPENAAPDKSAYYWLELPAAAFGKEGFYRFEIPAEMVEVRR